MQSSKKQTYSLSSCLDFLTEFAYSIFSKLNTEFTTLKRSHVYRKMVAKEHSTSFEVVSFGTN